MDDGKWDELPGEVYLRGFLVKYAQYLGLNGNELIKPYIDLQEKEEENQEHAGSEESDREVVEGFRMSWIWASLAVLIFVGLIKFFMPSGSGRTASPEASSSTQSEEVNAPIEQVQPAIPAKSQDHKIEVFTPEALWLRIVTESKTFEGFIPEGTSWTWTGTGQFQVRLGHTRGVALTFDGQPIALAENQKRVRLPYEN